MLFEKPKIHNENVGLIGTIIIYTINNLTIEKARIFFLKFIFLFIIINRLLDSIIIVKENFIHILPKINKNNIQIKTKNIKELFKSRNLIITNANLTNEYIHFIRPINEKINEINIDTSIYEKKFDENYFKKRKDQLSYIEYGKLCVEEKLIINTKTIKASDKPLISVILPSYNKENDIMKSIRSVQNQSLKNIEIIIVDDCSTDNSSKYFKYLIKTDPRIRLFTHLKNMSVWRSRIDGLLYSRGKYVIFFDIGDLYEDNYVLEDAYNIIEKYNLDSIKMFFRLIYDFNNLTYSEIPFNYNVNYTKIGNRSNMFKYDGEILSPYTGLIWNRLTRNDIFIKGLYLLSDNTLNIYKNLWEDRWWTRLADETSKNLLIIKRYCYLYYKNFTADNLFFAKTDEEKDKLVHEFVYFLYFELDFLPKKDNKNYVIRRLKRWNNIYGQKSLKRFKTEFYILDNLLKILINDPYVSNDDKIELNKILEDSLKRQNEIKNKELY